MLRIIIYEDVLTSLTNLSQKMYVKNITNHVAEMDFIATFATKYKSNIYH